MENPRNRTPETRETITRYLNPRCAQEASRGVQASVAESLAHRLGRQHQVCRKGQQSPGILGALHLSSCHQQQTHHRLQIRQSHLQIPG